MRDEISCEDKAMRSYYLQYLPSIVQYNTSQSADWIEDIFWCGNTADRNTIKCHK